MMSVQRSRQLMREPRYATGRCLAEEVEEHKLRDQAHQGGVGIQGHQKGYPGPCCQRQHMTKP